MTGKDLQREDPASVDAATGAAVGVGEPTFTEQLARQIGGVRGLLESGIPIVVFVVANLIWTLRPALIISVGSALAIAAWRLARRESIRHAINGLFGIALGGLLAWHSGSAKDFYLPGILFGFGYGLAMLLSVPLRMPVIGWAWSVVAAGGSTVWRQDCRQVRMFNWLTLMWAVTWIVKVGIQALIFRHTSATDPGTALGVARLLLGYPPYLILLAITYWVVRRSHARNAAVIDGAAAG